MRTWRSSAGAGIVLEGVQTGDGRVWAEGAFTWAPFPLPLAWMNDGTQHIDVAFSAPQIGTHEGVERDGQYITGWGYLDDENPLGAELARRMDAGLASHGNREFVSVDPDNWAFQLLLEVGAEEELLFASAGRAPAGATISTWNPLPSLARAGLLRLPRDVATRVPSLAALVAAAGDPDPGDNPDGYITLFEDSVDSVIMRFTASRLRGLTCVPTPAFDGAFIELEPAGVAASSIDTRMLPDLEMHANGDGPTRVSRTAGVLAAHAAPALSRGLLVPDRIPAEVFADPGPPNGSLNIEEFACSGYVALWDSCHNGYADRCVPPPQEDPSYAMFRHGQGRQLEDGDFVSTGVLTWGIPHADLDLDALSAFNHYADARHGFADVVVGANEHGIWHAGALRGPSAISTGITRDDVNVLRGLSLSGDWRYDFKAKQLRMIASLAVNHPGFPVPRITASASISDDARNSRHIDLEDCMRFDENSQLISLVAAGMERPALYAETAAAHACSCGTSSVSFESQVLTQLRMLDARTRHLRSNAADALLEQIRS
jgi:hypothetical protein